MLFRSLPYRLHCPAMDMRAEVWSPVQNVAVWLGAWLWGHESTDDLLDALRELGGEQQGANGEPFLDVMSLLRRETAAIIEGGEREPLLRLILSGPGEADALLSAATNESAALIEGMGYRSDALPNPRLTVGTLSDFYDTPGLPTAVPGRAAKLFARADRVAAIIETVTDRIHNHSLDPQLLRLWRHIRQARMAGVAYALTDFAR